MKYYGKAVMVDCLGLKDSHAYRDFCLSCAPFWEKIPCCPDHQTKLTEKGYCRNCKLHYEIDRTD